MLSGRVSHWTHITLFFDSACPPLLTLSIQDIARMLGWVYEQHGRKKAPSNGSITQLVDLVRPPSHPIILGDQQIR